MNTNIKEDSQICISVPLGISRLYVKQVETTLYFLDFFMFIKLFLCLWKYFHVCGNVSVFMVLFSCFSKFFYVYETLFHV